MCHSKGLAVHFGQTVLENPSCPALALLLHKFTHVHYADAVHNGLRHPSPTLLQ